MQKCNSGKMRRHISLQKTSFSMLFSQQIFQGTVALASHVPEAMNTPMSFAKSESTLTDRQIPWQGTLSESSLLQQCFFSLLLQQMFDGRKNVTSGAAQVAKSVGKECNSIVPIIVLLGEIGSPPGVRSE